MKHTFTAAAILNESLLSLIRKALQMFLIMHMQILKKTAQMKFLLFRILNGEKVLCEKDWFCEDPNI